MHLSNDEIRCFIDRILMLAQKWEFRTFAVGTRVRDDFLMDDAAEFKRRLNIAVALGVAREAPDFDPAPSDPDVTFLLHYPGSWIDVMAKPVFVYGRFRKLVRDLPQARWLCKRCHGHGCRRCGGTGRIYENSVEEIIAAPLLAAFDAQEDVMHAAGRQDVDVRMLGSGRPFAIELREPRRRSADLAAVADAVNSSGSVEVLDLRVVSRELVRRVDTVRAQKTYRALVEARQPVGRAELAALDALEGAFIEQQTPRRVAHRRADKVRPRRIHEFIVQPAESAEASCTFEIELRTDSGTYIKELIDGDSGRSQPSVSGILGIECSCSELDVLAVHFDPFHGASNGADA